MQFDTEMKERERRNLRKKEEQKYIDRFGSYVRAAQINESLEYDCFSLT